MAQPGFLNTNEHRAYPFLDEDLGMALPESAVVDFGCTMGVLSRFDPTLHVVYLHRIQRIGSLFRFNFRSTAPGLSNYSLEFERNLSDPEFSSSFSIADTLDGGSTNSASLQCSDDPVWEGFLQTGDLQDLADILPDGDTLEDAGQLTIVEPALIQNLDQSYVRSVNFANMSRTRVEVPEDCEETDTRTDGLFVHARCLNGSLTLKEGFNSTIRQSSVDNSITINAVVGGGAGEPCEEVPLYVGEVPPPGSVLLSGGPQCSEILKSINGVGGRTIRLQAGPGVRITPGSEEGQLIVGIDLHGMAVCRNTSITV